jgi:outer membrane protein assembly factor BamE
MKSSVVYSLSMAALLFVTGCSTDKIPGIYRIDIQQGNNVTQAMLNELEPGMTKNQVAYVMGNPLLIDTFHPNRWDYL